MVKTILEFIGAVIVGVGAFVLFTYWYGWMYLDVQPYLEERRRMRKRKRMLRRALRCEQTYKDKKG